MLFAQACCILRKKLCVNLKALQAKVCKRQAYVTTLAKDLSDLPSQTPFIMMPSLAPSWTFEDFLTQLYVVHAIKYKSEA